MGDEKDNRGKDRWQEVLESVKDLLGKSKKKKVETYVYLEVGEKYNIQAISREYIDKWKKEIYQ